MRINVAWTLGLLALLGSVWVGRGGEEATLSPTDIIRRSHDLLRDDSSYCVVTMEILRPKWSRTMSMQAWTRGTDESFIRVLSPAKDKGVAFLKKQREGWNYIPAIDRVIKIPPSMMMQAWMGSDFTNDDIVRADSIVTDYTHAITREFSGEDGAYWVIEAVPKPDAAVVWGKVVFTVRKQDLVASTIDYWDEDAQLVKQCRASQVRDIEGRAVPTLFTMIDLTREGYRTTVTYSELTFAPAMDPGLFTLSNLRR